MAKVLTGDDGLTHLRGGSTPYLCGKSLQEQGVTPVHDGVLTCPECAAIALNAVELVTKAEKRLWRQL